MFYCERYFQAENVDCTSEVFQDVSGIIYLRKRYSILEIENPEKRRF